MASQAAALLLLTTLASGGGPYKEGVSLEERERSAPPQRWYGGWTLGLDLGAVVLASAPWLFGQDFWTFAPAIGGAALALAVLGPPIAHAVHGNWKGGGLSLLMRTVGAGAVTALGVFLGWAIDPGSAEDGKIVGLGYGLLIGGLAAHVTATIVDSAVLAFVPERAPEGPTIAPAVSPGPDGGMVLGVVGLF